MIEDLDGEHAGYGAFWGEVQSNVHKALGCLGTVTNGSVRDIPMIPDGFQMLAGSISPSHAYVHVVEFGGEVNVHGMATRSGDLVHADRHGAVGVPPDKISAMISAAEALRIGLVNQVVPPFYVLETAVAMGGRIAANSPVAVRALKEIIDAALPVEHALERERELNRGMGRSPDSAARFRKAAERVIGQTR